MVDKELLSRKISRLREYLTALRKANDITWAKYKADLRTRAFVERYLHLCVGEVIDIGNHFVVSPLARAGGIPGSSRSASMILICSYLW